MRTLLFLLFCQGILLSGGAAMAQAPPVPDTGVGNVGLIRRVWTRVNAPPDTSHRGFRIFPVPVVGYSPETRIIAGVSLLSSVRLFPDVRASDARLEWNMTQNRQAIADLKVGLFTPGERYWLQTYLTWRYFPENFWGIGNRLPASAIERYEGMRLEGYAAVLRLVAPRLRLFIGPRYNFQYLYGIKPEAGGLLETGRIVGSKGGLSSGAGLQVALDHRNSTLNPHKGFFVQSISMGYGRLLGSQFGFGSFDIEGRKYFPIRSNRDVLAMMARLQFMSGDVPFRMMALIGASQELRGYYGGRYRDFNYGMAQVEYRFPLFWRFGMVVFAGMGDVYRHPEDLSLRWIKTSLGFGGRFKVDRGNDANVRIDLGFGQQGNYGLYIGYAEAF